MLNFNFNSNGNNKKQGGIVPDSLDKYYKKAKENIKRANILFPAMKDMKDDLEDEIEQWEKSKPKTNQDSTSGIGGTIRIPNDREETEEQRTIRLANSLYPAMKDKEEKPKEQAKDTPSSELDALFSKKESAKLSFEKEAPKFIDLGGGLFAEDKRPLNKKENKKEENKYFDINNRSKLNYQDEIKTITSKKEEPFVSINSIAKNDNKDKKVDNAFFSDEEKEQAREFIQKAENFKADAYKDTGGVWTIGYGHTKGVKPGDKITKEEAGKLFVEDFNYHSEPLKYVKVELSSNEKTALISFIYNVGVGAFKNSTLLKKLNQGDKQGAADEFDKWIYDNGEIKQGLINRRAKEKELFLDSDK